MGALVLCTVAIAPAQPRGIPGLTAAPQVRAAYDAIFDARFDEVPRRLAETCGPAPPEACRLLDALNTWWQIQLDPHNRSRDATFNARVNAAIAATAAWTVREPLRAEAWFYLGAAYGARVQWRSLRGETLAAARDGKRIKDALEQALALDPDMQDAWFGIGLYHYYAAIAPTMAQILRWLLFLPGGDREQGLQQMARAREGGVLVRSEADYQLHLIYIWFERAPAASLDLLAGLRRRHPGNPHFVQATARIQDVYLSDIAGSLGTWEALLADARAGRVRQRALAETSARLGAALQLDRLGRYDAAIAHLRAVIAGNPAAPHGAVSQAHLQLGDVHAHAGRADDAAAAYRLAITTAPAGDPLRTRARASDALRSLR